MICKASLRMYFLRLPGRSKRHHVLPDGQHFKYRRNSEFHLSVFHQQAACSATVPQSASYVAEQMRRDPEYASQVAAALHPETLATIVEASARAGKENSRVGEIQMPTYRQLWQHGIRQAVPFFGFGVFDNMVMICVGESIDSTFGVTLGFSTMVAAGFGQMVSDSAGITLQGIIERFADKLQLPDPKFSQEQSHLNLVHTVSQISRTIGIFLGCFTGMFPLLFLDTSRNKVSEKLLRVLPAEKRTEFYNSLEVVTFSEGDKIIEYGTQGEYLYLITYGSVEVIGRDDTGQAIKACDLDAGSLLGEIEFITGGKCVADVVATCDVRAQRLSKDEFIRIAGEDSLGVLRELVFDHNNCRYLYYNMSAGSAATRA
eukprot:TRINITY_DN27137_c0_g1_i1.p1 TRINITY_DN27137_c0_g1~~TRINITY_DN27137_c0_g1_i1.p1  ORF type:complete len:373 (-),score=51.60 TRINITY_DN27137_c0_g1_i1:183-1301(-)